MPDDYRSISYPAATSRLTGAVAQLDSAGKQLTRASRSAPDKYNADQLVTLAKPIVPASGKILRHIEARVLQSAAGTD